MGLDIHIHTNTPSLRFPIPTPFLRNKTFHFRPPCFTGPTPLLTSPLCFSIAMTRISNGASRCFVKDIDVKFNHVVVEDDLCKDGCSITSSCSFPVLSSASQLADIQETREMQGEEHEFLDSLLTELPVQSKEEQDAISATPVHPAGLYALYASFLAGNLVEQIWNFACPAAIALLYPSLLPVAVVGFIAKLGIFAGGPLVGSLMDSYPRVLAFNCLSIVQTAAQLISAGMIIYALDRATPAAASATSLLLQPWFVVLVLAGAIERLTGLASGVAFERDWVVLLAGTNRPIALARANAMLSRVDLLCEVVGASIFGILLSILDPVKCLKLAAALMICTLPVQVSKGVLERSRNHTSSELCQPGRLTERVLGVISHGWVQYKTQPVLPVSLAYVLLCFNAVLGPGGLMTSFLTNRGLNPSIIGAFSGMCAFMGIAATFISASLVKKLGLLKAGAAGLVFQALLLGIAVTVYWSGFIAQQKSLIFFLFLIVLSRLGQMSYDIVGGQILQSAIPASQANLIGATEVSMTSLAELVMLGFAIIGNDVSHFGFLALLSMAAVAGAAWIYCQWLSNPTKEQRQLFSFDPHFSSLSSNQQLGTIDIISKPSSAMQ
ncbi:solute carrier family 40 member 2, chloroplastic isoform X2 [Cryptomeria japonica]|uniref:solute carrier family 40 member 2, chloroplastic isoform X2 n=1 Tax=Cryptomeria japonica TaxID=3369 RepID=UPI0025AC7A9C|nr:solute carrier family 40 member 2, chloroplastic isoform X2 [Cryptomeria japonica]